MHNSHVKGAIKEGQRSQNYYPTHADYVDKLEEKIEEVSSSSKKDFSLPVATSDILGGVKIGENITNNDGKISVTKENVVDALGYIPPENDTTYPNATDSATGVTKLYSNTGTNTDGTITQKAITDALNDKLDKNATAKMAKSDDYGNEITKTYAPINSPALTGTPTAPTPDNDTDSDQIATTEFVQNLIRRLVGAAPETLNTLVELATAINNDPNFANTIVQALDGKLNKTDAATTYATKTDLANVQIDTSNFAKLDSTNTFTAGINIEDRLYIKNPSQLGDSVIKMENTLSANGEYFQIEHYSGVAGIKYYAPNNSGRAFIYLYANELEFYAGTTKYTFKSDGIYKGTTKIAG